MKHLSDLFRHQLKCIYSVETQLVGALPKLIEKASSDNLRAAFSDHLEETQGQIERLQDIGRSSNIELTGTTCEGMKGLIGETESFAARDTESDIRDAGIIANTQRIEHYEISSYGTVIEYAKALGENEAARLLGESLKEETAADEKLNRLAKDSINIKAKA